ncbi:DUF6112 family protein [Brevibacterium aurantiacum]|uniref:Integral membrane protein n=1 Tax=Brevibacterium aurantiacum TaxID=273384 RepID=A0A2A3WZJ6_BREAU|nr:DUF6112 family protein [Brevibacterium aurantiacum]PCC16856.1 hypothetical protein CIK79_00180 [Brevibacterium aurantiacum]
MPRLLATVFPDFDAIGGRDLILEVLGALLTIVLVAAVLSLLVSAILWALGAGNGNYRLAQTGRVGVLVSLGVAALAGAGVAWMNFLIDLGPTL